MSVSGATIDENLTWEHRHVWCYSRGESLLLEGEQARCRRSQDLRRYP